MHINVVQFCSIVLRRVFQYQRLLILNYKVPPKTRIQMQNSLTIGGIVHLGTRFLRRQPAGQTQIFHLLRNHFGRNIDGSVAAVVQL